MKKILITGSTGFVGGCYTALALNKYGVENVIALVRGDNKDDALNRLKLNLKKFHVSEELLSQLTHENIIHGDLSHPGLFFNDPRLESVSHVVNCAAIASFGNNPSIYKVNVEGTFEFARRMAEVSSLEKFLHVGTAMSCLPDQNELVYERKSSLDRHEHIVPYTLSKAEIEHKIQKDLPALPFIIARPSIVIGHTDFGCEASSSIFWVFVMALRMKRFLCNLDDCIDIIPVDYCAEALDILLTRADINNPIYHISAGKEGAVSFKSIDAHFARASNTAPIVEEYRKEEYGYFLKNRHMFSELFGRCNDRIILRSIALYGEFSKLNVAFSNEKLIALGLHHPKPFTTYIDKCLESTKGKTVMEMMECDFK